MSMPTTQQRHSGFYNLALLAATAQPANSVKLQIRICYRGLLCICHHVAVCAQRMSTSPLCDLVCMQGAAALGAYMQTLSLGFSS